MCKIHECATPVICTFFNHLDACVDEGRQSVQQPKGKKVGNVCAELMF